MIIVSQDKKTIMNFNNIQNIRIERYTTHKKEKYIYKIFGGNFEGYATEIGTYVTEKRAKEVLAAITNTFSAAELNGTLSEIGLILKAKFMARYEMPLE